MQKGEAYDPHMLLGVMLICYYTSMRQAFLLLMDFLCAPSCVGVLCIEDSGCDYGFRIRCALM